MTKIRIDINNITYSEYLKIQLWCRNNMMDFRADYFDWVGYLDTWWEFKYEEEAALFALRWS